MIIAQNIEGKKNQRCHLNAIKQSRIDGSDIYVGFYVDKRGGYISAIPHFWNVKGNEIIDTSIGTNCNHYFGKRVTEKYTSANKMFDCELYPLYKQSRIDSEEDLIKQCKENNFIELI
jgi:hypothetical protein